MYPIPVLLSKPQGLLLGILGQFSQDFTMVPLPYPFHCQGYGILETPDKTTWEDAIIMASIWHLLPFWAYLP